jgi:iron complex outermembrane receptor protein
VERAPRAPELFSRGAHEATGTFDIGNPNLAIEAAQTVEFGLRRTKGPFRFEDTAYFTRFHGFIYRSLTGETCEGDFASCTPAGEGGGLNQSVYAQRGAIFRGGEFQSQWDVAPLFRHDRNRKSVRRRSRDLHGRNQCPAHSAHAPRRRPVLA